MSEEQIEKLQQRQRDLVNQMLAIEKRIQAIDVKLKKLGGGLYYG